MCFHVSRLTFLKSRFGEVGHCGGDCSVSFPSGSRAQSPSMPVGFFLSWYPAVVLSCLLLSTSSSFPLCSILGIQFLLPRGSMLPRTQDLCVYWPTSSLSNSYLARGTANSLIRHFLCQLVPPVPHLCLKLLLQGPCSTVFEQFTFATVQWSPEARDGGLLFGSDLPGGAQN